MTIKQMRGLCWMMLMAGFVLAIWGSAVRFEHRTVALSARHDQIEVEYSDLASLVGEFDKRESEDQLRDWAVLGTLAHFNLDEDKLMQSTYRTPPVRLPYLEDAYSFEYGRGRFALVGQEEVLLFVEEQDPERDVTLARTADRVRQEIGEIPDVFTVYSVRHDAVAARLLIKRDRIIAGKEMFSPAWGYFERLVKDAASLDAWLKTVDYVTHARNQDGLVLGGRKLKGAQLRNATIEDVGAIYQAHRDLQTQREWAEREVSNLESQLNGELRIARTRVPDLGLDSDIMAGAGTRKYVRHAWAPVNEGTIVAEYQARADALRSVPEDPGFSLDPQWNIQGLLGALTELAAGPCNLLPNNTAFAELMKEARDGRDDARSLVQWAELDLVEAAVRVVRETHLDLGQVCQQIVTRLGSRVSEIARNIQAAPAPRQQDETVALLRFQRDLRLDDPFEFLLAHLIKVVEARHDVQCARYDGSLKGTRVGMNLFYTDLLAKIWLGVDYYRSAPAAAVPGFISLPRLSIASTWEQETRRLQATRLWFGPKPEAISRSDATLAKEVFFAPIATRVYAAGSDPLHPGRESQPNEESRLALGFWDRHYVDVADYEPEYYLQNEIIKWSMLSAWMRDQNLGAFLGDVHVDHSKEFPDWSKGNEQLRFRQDVPFIPKSRWISGTECVERLRSYTTKDMHYIEGGVSAGGKRVWELTPEMSLTKPRFLRSELTARVNVGPKGAGTAMRARPRYVNGGRSVVEASPETRFRARNVALDLGKVEVSVRRSGGRHFFAMQSDKGQVGALSLRRVGDRVALRWHPGAVERARRIASEVSELTEGDWKARPIAKAAPLRFGDQDAVVVPAVRGEPALKVTRSAPEPERSVLARSSQTAPRTPKLERGSDGKPHLTFEPGPTYEGRVEVLDESELNSSLDQYEWQIVAPEVPGSSAPEAVKRTFVHNAPEGAAEVSLDGIPGVTDPLKARVTADGTLYLQRPDGDVARQAWRNLDASLAPNPRDLEWIAEQVRAERAQSVSIGKLPYRRVQSSFADLRNGDVRRILKDFASDPAGVDDFVAQARTQAHDSAVSALEHGDANQAASLFDFAEEVLGTKTSDDILTRGIAEMRAGLAERAAGRFEGAFHGPGGPPPEGVRGAARFLFDGSQAGCDPDGANVLNEWLLGHDMPQGLGLAAQDGKVVSIFRAKRPLRGKRIDPTTVDSTGTQDFIYIEDTASFNRFDAEHDPFGTVAELRKTPKLLWVQVDEGEFGAYRPAAVAENKGKHYRRVKLEKIASTTTKQRRTILVRSCNATCDCDGDGNIDDQEREACVP